MLEHTGDFWTYFKPRYGRGLIYYGRGPRVTLAFLTDNATHADGHLMAAAPVLLSAAWEAVKTGDTTKLAQVLETLDRLADTN